MTITMVSKQNKAPPQNVFIITYIKCFIYYVKQLIQMFKKNVMANVGVGSFDLRTSLM